MATGESASFLMTPASYCIHSIIPRQNGGFVINVVTQKPPSNSCIYFDENGNETQSVTLNPVVNTGDLLAADTTCLYFENYVSTFTPDGISTCYMMPVCRIFAPPAVSENRTIKVYNPPSFYCYRLTIGISE